MQIIFSCFGRHSSLFRKKIRKHLSKTWWTKAKTSQVTPSEWTANRNASIAVTQSKTIKTSQHITFTETLKTNRLILPLTVSQIHLLKERCHYLACERLSRNAMTLNRIFCSLSCNFAICLILPETWLSRSKHCFRLPEKIPFFLVFYKTLWQLQKRNHNFLVKAFWQN